MIAQNLFILFPPRPRLHSYRNCARTNHHHHCRRTVLYARITFSTSFGTSFSITGLLDLLLLNKILNKILNEIICILFLLRLQNLYCASIMYDAYNVATDLGPSLLKLS